MKLPYLLSKFWKNRAFQNVFEINKPLYSTHIKTDRKVRDNFSAKVCKILLMSAFSKVGLKKLYIKTNNLLHVNWKSDI